MLITSLLMGTFALSSPVSMLSAAYAAPPPRMGGPGPHRGPGGPGPGPRRGPGGPGGFRPGPGHHGGPGHYRPAPPPPRHGHRKSSHSDALAVGGALLFLGLLVGAANNSNNNTDTNYDSSYDYNYNREYDGN